MRRSQDQKSACYRRVSDTWCIWNMYSAVGRVPSLPDPRGGLIWSLLAGTVHVVSGWEARALCPSPGAPSFTSAAKGFLGNFSSLLWPPASSCPRPACSFSASLQSYRSQFCSGAVLPPHSLSPWEWAQDRTLRQAEPCVPSSNMDTSSALSSSNLYN